MHVDNGSCVAVPSFDRLQYFYGQLLGANDLRVEQAYFREKLKLHNRCLHGYGVVCGLEVRSDAPEEDCRPQDDEERGKLEQRLRELRGQLTDELRRTDPERYYRLEAEIEQVKRQLDSLGERPNEESRKKASGLYVDCGIALDCEGNELVVREPLLFEPWRLLDPSDRRRVERGETTLYVSICFHEQPIEPTRPIVSDACGTVGACTYGKVRDSVCLHVAVDEPRQDTRCDTCCGACECECLLLARIDDFEVGVGVPVEAIDNSVRRELGTHVPTTVTGVSWSHGGLYAADEARQLLGADDENGGLEFRLSAPVWADGLAGPVVDVTVSERGRGRAANKYELAGDFVGVPPSGMVTSFRYRQTSGETLQDGDLVLITFRAPLVLDRCCHPVQGLNVGGRVPLLAEFEQFRRGDPPTECEHPPFKAGPWTAHYLGNFESWFSVGKPEDTR